MLACLSLLQYLWKIIIEIIQMIYNSFLTICYERKHDLSSHPEKLIPNQEVQDDEINTLSNSKEIKVQTDTVQNQKDFNSRFIEVPKGRVGIGKAAEVPILGRGGYGIVIEGKFKGKPCALKRVPIMLTDGHITGMNVDMNMREIKALATLSHGTEIDIPIVKYFGVMTTNDFR